MANNGFAQWIREAKAYRKLHPKDKYWKHHFKLSKGAYSIPPLGYKKKKVLKTDIPIIPKKTKLEDTKIYQPEKDTHMKKVSRRIR